MSQQNTDQTVRRHKRIRKGAAAPGNMKAHRCGLFVDGQNDQFTPATAFHGIPHRHYGYTPPQDARLTYC